MGILEKIKDIEEEMARTQINKKTEYHIGLLKGKLAKLRTQLLEMNSSSGPSGAGFEVGKFGDARCALMGFPSVGKSSLLAKLTGVESEVAAYEFTTLTCIPGTIHFNDAKIQLLDLPGIVQGASAGAGRGRQVISTAKTADLILMILDATKDNVQRQLLEKEMEIVGVRLNRTPPDITLTKKPTGGIKTSFSVPCQHLNDKMVEGILKDYKIHNADVVVREDATVDDLIDVIEGNRKYCKCLYVYNKIDMLSMEQIDELAKAPMTHVVSAEQGLNLEALKERIWHELEMVRVYTKKHGAFPDFADPIVLTPQRGTKQCTVENAVKMLHRDLIKEFRNATVWGASAKNGKQTVGLKHCLADEDVLQIQKMTVAERARARHGKKTGTTIAGTGLKVEKKKDELKKTGPKS